MSSRPGIVASVRRPADGGTSPNRYIPEITAELRVFWPPLATTEEIGIAVREVLEQALRQIGERRAGSSPEA